MLTTCYGIRIEDGLLTLPAKVKISLNSHTVNVVSEPGLDLRSVTFTTTSLSIAFARSSEPMQSNGMIGLDANLDNITLADTKSDTIRFDLSKVTRIRTKARQTKRRFRRREFRIRRSLYREYGNLEEARVGRILHNVSSNIVKRAKEFKMAIAMENLAGIRKLYRKGNGQGKDYRFKMNS